MLKSMQCLGLQCHNGARPVLIGCMVLKVELTFLIPSSKALCLVEVSYLAEDIKSNTSISRTIQCINTGLAQLCHWGLVLPMIFCTIALEVSMIKWVYIINGGSHPLPVMYVFSTSTSNYIWWRIIDHFLYLPLARYMYLVTCSGQAC